MESAVFSVIRKRFFFVIGYASLFLALWYSSTSQWFLPAGLRAAALLFLPRRIWPYVFAGDALATLVIRAPKIDHYSFMWAYVSPFLLLPAMSLALVVADRLSPGDIRKPRIVPLAMLGMALWASVVNAFVNGCMGGPVQEVSLEMFGRFATGQYLGMLTIGLPVLFWYRRHDAGVDLRRIGLESATALCWLVLCSLFAHSASDLATRQSALTLMLLPAVALTIRQGWRGAAIGVALANVAIGLTMPNANVIGDYDSNVFVAQQVLAVIGTAMMILGARLSSSIERGARMLSEAERKAIQLARRSNALAESDARKIARSLAVSQMSIAWGYEGLIEDLKASGRFELAMQATRQGAINAQLLLDHTSAIYPLGIETEGLYWAIRSMSFANACDSEITTDLRGSLAAVSSDLQVLAYRCICNAVGALPGAHSHHIRARTWRRGANVGLAVSVRAHRADNSAGDDDARAAANLLRSRVLTHGGSYRSRHGRITLILPDLAAE